MVKYFSKERNKNLMSKFVPTYYARNLYDIDPAFFAEIGVKTLLLDLDNTLASYKEKTASARTLEYLELLKAQGLNIYIVSNNSGKRVRQYALSANLKYISGARKPLIGKIKKFLKNEGIPLDEVMMIGDQVLTDVYCANRLGVKIILTDKLVKEDQWTTRINRLLDRPIRRRLSRKNKLKEWHNYGPRTEES